MGLQAAVARPRLPGQARVPTKECCRGRGRKKRGKKLQGMLQCQRESRGEPQPTRSRREGRGCRGRAGGQRAVPPAAAGAVGCGEGGGPAHPVQPIPPRPLRIVPPGPPRGWGAVCVCVCVPSGGSSSPSPICGSLGSGGGGGRRGCRRRSGGGWGTARAGVWGYGGEGEREEEGEREGEEEKERKGGALPPLRSEEGRLCPACHLQP